MGRHKTNCDCEKCKNKKKKIEKDLVDKPIENVEELSKDKIEKKNKLKSILREINKSGKAEIQFANEIEDKGRISFGYKCLDDLTGGGMPKGTYTTVWGSKGCGKSTIAYKAIASLQKQGLTAVYIDMERSFSKIWAEHFGVNTEDLIYVATKEAEDTLDVVIRLCREKVCDLIVLDSLHGMSPHGEQYKGKADKERSVSDDSMALLARKLSQFFRMATPYVSDSKCAVLLIGQSRVDLGSFVKCEVLSGGNALAHNSRLILRVRRGQKVDGEFKKVETGDVNAKGKPVYEKVQTGFSLVVKVEKSQVEKCIENNNIHTVFNYENGIVE